MSKVTMPEPVATAYETETGVPRFTPTTYGAAIIKTGDEIITTTQAEAYADARVREVLRSLLRDMNGHVRAAHSRFGETGKPYDEGRRIAYEQAAADIRALIPPQK